MISCPELLATGKAVYLSIGLKLSSLNRTRRKCDSDRLEDLTVVGGYRVITHTGLVSAALSDSINNQIARNELKKCVRN